MNVVMTLLKGLLMIGLVCLMAAPLLLEYLSYKKDREDGLSHKRFRLFVFSVVYFIAITVVMLLLEDLLQWIQSWRVIIWLSNQLAIPARVDYAVAVFAVILLNAGIGFLFKLLLKLVRIGLKKKELVKPKGKDGAYTRLQEAERAVLRFFHNEKWFFAARMLAFVCIALSAAYGLLFFAWQMPIFWDASWIRYDILARIFEAGYIYPIITLLPLCEAYFFLAGVEQLREECPELVKEEMTAQKTDAPDLQKVNVESQKLFRDYFQCQLPEISSPIATTATEYHAITKLIAEEVEADTRNPQTVKDGYLNCIDAIVRNDLRAIGEETEKKTTGILVVGSFFSEFSMYFLRYVSAILSRGDNVVFVCNDAQQIETVGVYVTQAMSQMYSLYHSNGAVEGLNFDDPIWKICKVSSDHDGIERARIDECSVLITDLQYLCSRDFERNHTYFANLIDTVVFVDAMASVNAYPRQMALFVTSVKNTRDLNALRAKNSSENEEDPDAAPGRNDAFRVRYSSNQIKYICFDDSRTPGLDKVLNNLLSVEFESADAMKYAPQTMICCYNYEAKRNDFGKRVCPQAAMTTEELGVLVNMADFSLAFGAGTVSLFAERGIPYADIAESLAANANNGLLARENVNLRINDPSYNPDDYSVIVAFDAGDNLPAAIRRYAAMTPEKPTLVMVFSRPYLFRDYYVDNVEKLWRTEQLMRIPVEQSDKQNAIRRILVKANSGGIFAEEIISILQDVELPDYREPLASGDLNTVLRMLLVDCGIPQNNALDLFDFFAYSSYRDFDKDGHFVSKDKIRLRRNGALFDYINGLDLIHLITRGEDLLLPLTKDRITQNYISGQNMLYNGNVYTIDSIDTAAGKLYARHATGGRNNAPYQYLQDREYRIDWSDEAAVSVYPTKRVECGWANADKTYKEVVVSVKRRPMEVITKGYTPVDHRTLARNGVDSSGYVGLADADHQDIFKQCYRRYGAVDKPVCSSDAIMSSAELISSPNGALVMSVRVTGDFGGDAKRISTLAAAMLSETLREMFPSVAECVAVCPVISEPFTDEQSAAVLSKQYKAVCSGRDVDPNDFELLIIEDCENDLGVISVLMGSGDDVLKMLFSPIHKYLSWYADTTQKSDYLYYGEASEPACFDFPGLSKLAGVLGSDSFETHLVDVEEIAQYEVCDFCGRRFLKGQAISVLEDGRKMCADCGATLVGNDKKALKAHLDRARVYLESTYGISLGDDYEFCFESTVKIANTLKQNRALAGRGSDLPMKSYVDDKMKVHVEYALPSVNLSELLVRELTHVWQLKNLPDLAEDMAEGHIALVGIQYLRFLNQHGLAAVRTTYYESAANISGEGYRRLVYALLTNPQYRNNPFAYLLEASGAPVEDRVKPPVPRVTQIGDYGLPYTPEKPDRVLDGMPPYYYYPRLTATWQRAYDAILAAARNHERSVALVGVDCSDLREISDAVSFDHPELFWFSTVDVEDGEIVLRYGCTAEEAAVLQRQMDEVVPKYLEGIDDTMSAYDVALRLHVRMIGAVDYDTLTLRKEERTNGPAQDKVDYIRSICGVFLDGKAVCEGYARAMQYLLQKCGVECAEVAGFVRKANGESAGGHAWNIIKIDGDYYYLDTTWDDSSNTVQTVKNTDLGFDYFCITTEELTRTRDTSLNPIKMPILTATRANYHYHNDCVLDRYDLEKVKDIAQRAAQSKNPFFTFKCKTRAVYEEAMERLYSSGDDAYAVLKAAAKVDKQIATDCYGINPDENIWAITVCFKKK